MPRLDPITGGREKKARSIIGKYSTETVPTLPSKGSHYHRLDFAVNLPSKLRDAQSIDLLLAELGHQINTTTALSHKAPLHLPSRTTKDLERHDRYLWNLCIRLKRDGGGAIALFAFYMLELGRQTGTARRDAESEVVYLMGLAMMLGRVCLEGDDLESSRAALQKAAEYIERLRSFPATMSESCSRQARVRLEADYLSMRMALVRFHDPSCFEHWLIF